MLKLLPVRERRPAPWKNGQGQTTEVAVHPPGAGLDRFDWRVSMAQVAVSGPFSSFAGVDRWLAVLSGAMDLTIDGAAPVALDPDAAPIEFPGDVPVWSQVRAGPVLDLNIMTARARVAPAIRRLRLAPGARLRLDAAHETLVVCLSGTVAVRAGAASADLAVLDAVLAAGEPGLRLDAEGPAAIVAARFTPLGG